MSEPVHDQTWCELRGLNNRVEMATSDLYKRVHQLEADNLRLRHLVDTVIRDLLDLRRDVARPVGPWPPPPPQVNPPWTIKVNDPFHRYRQAITP